jgi:hypothetical protein
MHSARLRIFKCDRERQCVPSFRALAVEMAFLAKHSDGHLLVGA